jgi:micrococcal nuclease
MSALLLCLVAAVTDGDSIRCQDGTRLRLAGIDAPEMSPCRRGRICAPGNAVASRDNLRRLAGRSVRYRIVDANLCRAGFQATDHYGRRVVRAYVGGIDLSRAQLRGGFAVAWRCG